MAALTLTNRSGNRVSLNPVGAALTGIFVPDRAGSVANVCVDAGGSAGKIIGRYANRIARGAFTLDGTAVVLATNEGRNTLHGGPDGFSKRTWEFAGQSEGSVTFALRSPDGDQGFPGTLDCSVRYSWSAENALRIDYTAATDNDTSTECLDVTNAPMSVTSGVVEITPTVVGASPGAEPPDAIRLQS